MGCFSGPNISYDGIALNFDASNNNSYAGTGNTWFDVSGNGAYCGTLTGLTFAGTGSSEYFNFPGTNSAAITNISHLQWGAGPRTVISWVMTNTITGWAQIFGFGTATSNAASGMAISSGSKWATFQHNTASYEDGTPVAYTWTHVAMTQAASAVYIYINGAQTYSNTGITITANSGTAYIGANFADAEKWNGRIAQLLFYNRALTVTEILQHYNSTRGRYGL